ncbi:MAG: serine protease, partial [Terriglobia bacterium]
MKKQLIWLAVVATACLTPAFAQTAPKSREAIRLSFAPIVKQAVPAVVNVFSRRVVRANASPFADDPFF